MKKNIESFLKENQITEVMYKRISCLKDIPFKDYANVMKLSLILKVRPYTMVSYQGLSNIYDLAMLIEKNNMGGAFVECGVWRGGCAAIMARVAYKFGNKRKVWLFDSFGGLPEPTEEDGEMAREFADDKVLGRLTSINKCMALRNDVLRLFSSLKLNMNNVMIEEGWFQSVLPKFKNKIGSIAVLRLDCDWYSSTRYCLENLYENVISKGYLVIDDYGYWEGCKKATDEFLAKKKISTSLLRRVDDTCYYFQKP